MASCTARQGQQRSLRHGVRSVLAEVALVAHHDQAGGGQGLDEAPDPGRGRSWTAPGPGHPRSMGIKVPSMRA